MTEGGTTTDLYCSAAGQVIEEDVGGNVQAQNVWSPVYVNALVLRDQSSQHNGVLDQRLYVQQDANWNVTALVDASGNVVERYDYLPYGAVTVLNPSWSVISQSAYNVPYGFQGMRSDAVVSVNLAWGRVYDPALMRWLQTDPIGLNAGNNDYAMEGNGPTNAVDPSGLEGLTWSYFWKTMFSWDTPLFLLGLKRDGLGGVEPLKPGVHEDWAKDTAADIMIAMPQTRAGALIGGAYDLAHQGLGNVTDLRRGRPQGNRTTREKLQKIG